jgi:glycerol-1-phosphate dehydrogenase [NAD(P)+]
MGIDLPVYIGKDAIARLTRYCNDRGFRSLMLVADQNTYRALGERVEAELRAAGAEVISVVLSGKEIVADEYYIMQVLKRADKSLRTYIAVGSGTLTDITRFASHRQRTDFISVPTAASVDGFTSVGAPLVLGGWKQTVPAQPPIAVFGDETTLQTAPARLTAAGFGDMLGKYTSLSDWRIGHLLWDEPFDEGVFERGWAALQKCMANAEAIGHGDEEGICTQMEGLVESGLCMVEVGSSRPAGGSEHHLSHFWEMKFMEEGRPAALHGAKVGLATTLVARRYQAIRSMSQAEVAERLRARPLPNRDDEVATIERIFPGRAETPLAEQAPYYNMTPDAYEALKARIVEHWPQIQEIAQRVPPPERLIELLSTVGAPTVPAALGLSDADVAMAQQVAHRLRNRFTAMKLAYIIGF